MSYPPKPPICPVCCGENETFIGVACPWCDANPNIHDSELWNRALKAELARRVIAQPEIERRAGRLKETPVDGIYMKSEKELSEYDGPEAKDEEPLPPQELKGRCSGHCCKAFQIGGLSIEELRHEYECWLRGQTGERLTMSGTSLEEGRRFRAMETVRADIHVVFPMLIPLGKVKKNPLPLVDDPGPIPKDWEGVHMFGCKHYQGGNCTIHDVRPLMCRQYGLREKSCEYIECTWDGHRAEKRARGPARKYRHMDEPVGDPELEEELVVKVELGDDANLRKLVSKSLG